MLDPKKQALLDQASSHLQESVPSMIRGLYVGLIEEFNDEQKAWELTKVALFAMMGGKGISQ